MDKMLVTSYIIAFKVVLRHLSYKYCLSFSVKLSIQINCFKIDELYINNFYH